MSINEFKTACKKSVTHLQQSLGQLQLGRASTWLVENVSVHVESRGSTQKLNQIANLSLLDAQTIKIEPWDKSVLNDIEKSIRDAELGLNPLNHGEHILIKVPPLTEERRKELTKVVNKEGEETRIAIRNHRQDARKTVDNQFQDDEISENEKNNKEAEIDEITQEFNDKIDTMVENKKEEIMKV